MKKHEILIIEDELTYLDYIGDLLSKDYITHHSTNLSDAITLLENNVAIQIVITDLVLSPFKSYTGSFGYDIIRELKIRRPNLFIIVYSVVALPSNSLLGADFFVSKLSIDSGLELIEVIKQIVSKVDKLDNVKNKEEELLSETRRLLKKELENYAEVKEKSLSIPQEGNFSLIKPLIGFKRDIERQLSKFDYSKNIFLMMKFRDTNKDLSDYILETLSKNGFNGVRADQKEWNITQNVYNPIAVSYCCKFGIALFDEPEDNQAYNPNVAYELGIMHTFSKQCLILRHETLPTIPFDLIKEIYINYKKDLEIKKILSNWIYQIQFTSSI